MSRRFFAPPEKIDGATITLSKEETHHLARVLRLHAGEETLVFDGRGNEFRCVISEVRSHHARLEIIERLGPSRESDLDLTLAQGLAKGEKFDLIVQKATELGVSRIVALATENSDVKLDEQRSARRVERWRRISLEAIKQCGRSKLVVIDKPVGLEEFLEGDRAASSALLLFSEKGGTPIKEAVAGLEGKPVTALVGPEGGWSPREFEMLDARNARAISLGPRIIRAETAALVALALIQHLLGDMP
jgi:16S rRNA (uracil1498-N3)-methyltransferase